MELSINENTIVDINITPVFTRYLYIKSDVYISLFLSIIKKDKEQSLFWAYELYYSGFHYELLLFIEIMYKNYYSFNKKKCDFLEKKINEFRIFKDREWILATIIVNMIIKNKKNKKIIYIIYDINDVIQYRTLCPLPENYGKNWKILREVCIYSTIKKNYIENIPSFLENIMKLPIERSELKDIYHYYWQYYAYFTPVWKERFDRYHVKLDHENKEIYFPSDELKDEFCDRWDYEPDEQPMWIFDYCIGNEEKEEKENITFVIS